MVEDILLFSVAFVFCVIGAVIWKINDDFKRDTRGLTKSPSNRR